MYSVFRMEFLPFVKVPITLSQFSMNFENLYLFKTFREEKNARLCFVFLLLADEIPENSPFSAILNTKRAVERLGTN